MSDARAAWVTLAAALLPVAVISAVAWVHPLRIISAGLLAIALWVGAIP